MDSVFSLLSQRMIFFSYIKLYNIRKPQVECCWSCGVELWIQLKSSLNTSSFLLFFYIIDPLPFLILFRDEWQKMKFEVLLWLKLLWPCHSWLKWQESWERFTCFNISISQWVTHFKVYDYWSGQIASWNIAYFVNSSIHSELRNFAKLNEHNLYA